MKSFFYLLLSLLIISCAKEVEFSEPLDFANLRAGQIATFQGYSSSCEGFKHSFGFNGDRLQLKIVEKDGVLFAQEHIKWEESYSGEYYMNHEYPIKSNGQVVTIPSREYSLLFWFSDTDDIRLAPEESLETFEMECITSITVLNNVQQANSIDRLDLGGSVFYDVNTVTCFPLTPDAVNRTNGNLIFQDNKLLASHKIYEQEIDDQIYITEIVGWYLME